MKNILLGISGSVAAYKTPELCRLLQKAGFNIKVILTAHGKDFVSPLTLKALVKDEVYIEDSWDNPNQNALLHIDLARWADYILLAPSSANLIAKIAHGLADDLLTTTYLATQAPCIIAPSMNVHMWNHHATQANVALLKQRGVVFLGPDSGEQACGDVGSGRLTQLTNIVDYFVGLNTVPNLWQGKHIMITAGPTVEPIDPVRFMSNYSSGKMGYALANAALNMGARVTLISGPTQLNPLEGIDMVYVSTSKQMLDTIMQYIHGVDIFIGSAAVADWQMVHISEQKIKNKEGSIILELKPNVDIIAHIASLPLKPFMVGFAAETQDIEIYAQKKRTDKKLDMVIANDVSQKDIGFMSDDNSVSIITQNQIKVIPKMSKQELAFKILEEIYTSYANTQ